MSQSEAEILMNALKLPESYTISTNEVKQILQGTGLPSLIRDRLSYIKKKRTQCIPIEAFEPTKKPQRKIKPVLTVRSANSYTCYSNTPTSFNHQCHHQNSSLYLMEINYSSLKQLELKLKTYKEGTLSIDDFITLQDLDIDIHNVNNKEKNSQGIWCKRVGTELMPFIPTTVASSYISRLHFDIKNNHMSPLQIKRKIEQVFHLINSENTINRTIKGCIYCTMSIVHRKPKHSFFPNKIPNAPRTIYYFDLLGGIGISKGHKWIYICVDAFTGYVILKAAKSKKANEIQSFILNSIICPHGIFKQIVFDGELSLEWSSNFEKFLDLHAIIRTTTAVGSHHSLGICERIVSKVKEALRKTTFKTNMDWSDLIGIVNSSINKTVLTYNVSSERVLYGQDLDNSWKPLTIELETLNPDEYSANIKQITKEARKVLQRHKDRKAKENISYINKKTKNKTFRENQIVTYSNLKLGKQKSMAVKNIPCQIIATMRSTAYVKDLLTNNFSKQHYSNLNDFQHDEDVILPENWQEHIAENFIRNSNRFSQPNQSNSTSGNTTPHSEHQNSQSSDQSSIIEQDDTPSQNITQNTTSDTGNTTSLLTTERNNADNESQSSPTQTGHDTHDNVETQPTTETTMPSYNNQNEELRNTISQVLDAINRAPTNENIR